MSYAIDLFVQLEKKLKMLGQFILILKVVLSFLSPEAFASSVNLGIGWGTQLKSASVQFTVQVPNKKSSVQSNLVGGMTQTQKDVQGLDQENIVDGYLGFNWSGDVSLVQGTFRSLDNPVESLREFGGGVEYTHIFEYGDFENIRSLSLSFGADTNQISKGYSVALARLGATKAGVGFVGQNSFSLGLVWDPNESISFDLSNREFSYTKDIKTFSELLSSSSRSTGSMSSSFRGLLTTFASRQLSYGISYNFLPWAIRAGELRTTSATDGATALALNASVSRELGKSFLILISGSRESLNGQVAEVWSTIGTYFF